ncbi:murI [Acrasis kona]|uniref:MurI n=1 Tax=Acrasis kona TaxID=1008807 RepID=A0AAW2ZDJ7_9EUKA
MLISNTTNSAETIIKWLKVLALAVPALFSSILLLLLRRRRRTKRYNHKALKEYALSRPGQELGSDIERVISLIEGKHFGRKIIHISKVEHVPLEQEPDRYVVDYELNEPDLLRDQIKWTHTALIKGNEHELVLGKSKA